jgi:hypothetical protein
LLKQEEISFTQSNWLLYSEMTYLNFEHSTFINIKITKIEFQQLVQKEGDWLLYSEITYLSFEHSTFINIKITKIEFQQLVQKEAILLYHTFYFFLVNVQISSIPQPKECE